MTSKADFIVICQSAWMNDSGFGINYSWDRERFSTRKRAIKHGWKVRGSDDFNIGIVEDDKLVWFGWMDEPMDDDIVEIADGIGLKAGRAALKETGK